MTHLFEVWKDTVPTPAVFTREGSPGVDIGLGSPRVYQAICVIEWEYVSHLTWRSASTSNQATHLRHSFHPNRYHAGKVAYVQASHLVVR